MRISFVRGEVEVPIPPLAIERVPLPFDRVWTCPGSVEVVSWSLDSNLKIVPFKLVLNSPMVSVRSVVEASVPPRVA